MNMENSACEKGWFVVGAILHFMGDSFHWLDPANMCSDAVHSVTQTIKHTYYFAISWNHGPLGSVSQDNSNNPSKCNSPSSDKENSSDDKDKSPKKWTPPKVGHFFWICTL